MMAGLKVFRQVGKVADTDFLALEVLPVLWSFSLGPLLNLNQFNDFMALIKSLSAKIEKEQTRKLRELSSGGGSGGFQNGSSSLSQSATDFTSPDTDSTRNNFERLVLGRSATPSNGNDMDLWGSMEPEPSASKRPSMSPGYSWSMNHGAAPNQSGTSSQLGFRSVTPDQKLNSFPSLQPAQQTSPAVSSFPTMQPSSPTWNAQAQGANRAGPSLASLSGMAAGNPMSRPTTQQAPKYSAFSIPPPPGSMASSNAMRSPPLSMNTTPTPFQHQAQPQQPPTRKGGLDKYESLL